MFKETLAWILSLLGFLSPLGYILNKPALTGIGTAYMVSPLPLVFSAVKDNEAFANQISFELRYKDNTKGSIVLGPKNGKLLQGPYNRRNVYGAAISYAPVLPEVLVKRVLYYGFCKGSLWQELALKEQPQTVHLFVHSKSKGQQGRFYSWEISCN